MVHPAPRLAALTLAVLAVACGGDDGDGGGPGDLDFPPLVWRWAPLQGSVCGDGSQTGIGVERGPGTSPNVLVFLDGGGACWDTLTCFPPAGVPLLASPGPFGAAQFEARIAVARTGSVLDRSAPGNPYRDFTFVFVPYCTGDVHAGDRSVDYPGAPRRWQHRGRVNVANAFEFLPTVLDAPAKVVVSGASAGGFGSLLAFKRAKGAWPSAKGYLVDDSGPPLANIPSATVAAWIASWDLAAVVADVCGIACATIPPAVPTLAPVLPSLAEQYPSDRFALLSSTGDEVIRGFFGTFTATFPFLTLMDENEFAGSLRNLAADMEDDDPPGESHAFIVAGTTHPMLNRPGSFSSQGVTLFEWLRRQVEDDPAWAAAIAP